jgi:hypothetical protein
MMYVVE